MDASDLRKVLDAALHNAANRISLTVTDVPDRESHLRQLLEGAFGAGQRAGLPLTEVQLSLDRFPSLPARFSLAPVTDSGHRDVVRFIYDPQS